MTAFPPAPPNSVPSPCVRCCTLNEQDVCLGCGRTLDDIRAWTTLSDTDKAACVVHARQRLRELGRPVPLDPGAEPAPDGLRPR